MKDLENHDGEKIAIFTILHTFKRNHNCSPQNFWKVLIFQLKFYE